MRARSCICLLAVTAALATATAAWGQWVPPGATLPDGGIAPGPGYRPPGATQPDTGMITPGPGLRPPAATVPRGMPPPRPLPSTVLPRPQPQPQLRTYPPSQPSPMQRKAARERNGGRPFPPAKNLDECLSRWSPKERVSQSEWQATCRRLEVSGRAFKE